MEFIEAITDIVAIFIFSVLVVLIIPTLYELELIRTYRREDLKTFKAEDLSGKKIGLHDPVFKWLLVIVLGIYGNILYFIDHL